MSDRKAFTAGILQWHAQDNHREMPWKGERDPYRIWLSEIILQQTRVAQGWDYYLRFIAAYPTVYDLANASDDQVMKLWEGLGYYARARNLLAAARYIVDERGGLLPTDHTSWKTIQGVGPYTAAAIASFAYNEDVPVVDGNVYRILARYFGLDTPTDTTTGKKLFRQWAEDLLPAGKARDYNQAIMDFGATMCTPKTPYCKTCPLQTNCVAYQMDKVSQWPVKSKKLVRKTRFFHYLVYQFDGYTYIRKRRGKDIWQGLHDFPLVEDAGWLSAAALQRSTIVQQWQGCHHFEWREQGRYHQQLSHQNIQAVFYEIQGRPTPEADWLAVPQEEIANFAFPKIVDCYLKDNTLYLTLY